jgi:hypothetical protein
MNTKRWLICSVLLNVLLGIAWLTHQRPAPPQPKEPRPEARDSQAPPVIGQGYPEKINRATASLAQPLRWSDLQADDLKEYAANLRAAECPEATTFVIICNEAREQALPRVTAIVDEVRDRFYEELAATEGNFMNLAKPQQEKLEKLAEELDDLLEKALGRSGWSWYEQASETRSRTALLEVLSADERDGVFEIRKRYAAEYSSASTGQPHFWQRSKEEIARSEAEELKALLGEQKYYELKLMESPEASVIRERSGFDATREEWREILAIQRDCKSTNAPTVVLAQALAQALGPERAMEFEDHSRPVYREFDEVIREAGLPSPLIKEGCELEAAFQKREQEIKSAPMPDMLKRSELSILQAERLATLRTLLGDEPAEAYERVHQRH